MPSSVVDYERKGADLLLRVTGGDMFEADLVKYHYHSIDVKISIATEHNPVPRWLERLEGQYKLVAVTVTLAIQRKGRMWRHIYALRLYSFGKRL